MCVCEADHSQHARRFGREMWLERGSQAISSDRRIDTASSYLAQITSGDISQLHYCVLTLLTMSLKRKDYLLFVIVS